MRRDHVAGAVGRGLRLAGALGCAVLLLTGAAPRSVGWETYLGGPNGDLYSPLTQIDKGNVKQLKMAWRQDTGPGGLQTNPLVIGRTLYAYTPQLHVIALDATTGKRQWEFDPGFNGTQPSRGVSYWSEGGERRIFAGTMNWLYALDPDTGRPIPGFGKDGRIDLRENLRGKPEEQTTWLTSPGAIYRDTIIVGFRTSESHPSSPGAIRAYDVRTGALRWTFNTVPQVGDPGYPSWAGAEIGGGANNWVGMVIDQQRGIVFVPTSPATADFYGVDRKGENLYSDSLIALDAATGKRLWHFQAVHHDLWDRDFPAAPVLVQVRRGGKVIDAVAQNSKQGYLYLFERTTGKPLFPIVERPFPPSTIPDEHASPTQPIPLKPEPYARQRLTEDMLSRRTPEVHAWAVQRFRTFRSDGPFVPLEEGRQTVVFPGFDGGAEWGGQAVDRRTGVMYINANDIPWTGALQAVKSIVEEGEGGSIYGAQCAGCHGADRKGAPPAFPSLIERAAAMSDAEITQAVRTGKGRMPPFPWVTPAMMPALIQYIRTGASPPGAAPVAPKAATATHRFTGFNKFYDPEGYPAVAPPWGTLNAIDLATGKYLWKVPLGYYPELAAKGMGNTGTENYGGPVVTASGLLFIGGTIFDRRFRAFDAKTGKLLWEAELPFAGVATPAIYMIDGKQYVVIATSGARDKKGPQGSAYVAFALPGV